MTTSRIPGFHNMTLSERRNALGIGAAGFAEAGVALADNLSENVIGTFNLPLGVATNLIVDGQDVLVPMVTEESSVVAAVCNGAKACRDTGGVETSNTGARMIGQIQIRGLSDPFEARERLAEHEAEILSIANACDPVLVKLGGGCEGMEMRVVDADEPLLIVHLMVNVADAMGANAVNTMAEACAPHIANWIGGQAGLRILSNLADKRLIRASARFDLPIDVRDGIVSAGAFAIADPYRAATHNKGIMNGVSAVVLATGNDTRAIEAGAHAYAAHDGQYRALTTWGVDETGALKGSLEMPMAVGIVGGATKAHPTAAMCLNLMNISDAARLASIIGAVGLIQNFSALRALATEGIQRGHMSLHARNVAIAAGATGNQIDAVANAMIEQQTIRQDVAETLLTEMS